MSHLPCGHAKSIFSGSDGLIAATVLCYGLHVMTRNVKYFKETGAFIMELDNGAVQKSHKL